MSDSSLALDQRDKTRLYASASVQQYWIVNLPDLRIEVYSSPANGAFATAEHYTSGDLVLRCS